MKAEYERLRSLEDVAEVVRTASKFAEFAKLYIDEATSHLADTTRSDRRRLLIPAKEGEPDREAGLTAYFGGLRLDQIGRRELTEWWGHEIDGKGRSRKTGKNYLDALSAVFAYAEDLEIISENPTHTLRRTLARRRSSRQGRAETDPGANIKPLEPAEVVAFFAKSAEAGGTDHLCDVLLLDAGLRVGEAHGLRWSDVWWGRAAEDTTRSLVLRETVARGRHVGTTKSGRERRVALSRRLRALLREEWLRVARPEGDVRVLPGTFEPANYRHRHFQPVCIAAELGHRRPKDLRDTFASQLLTAGVQLGYVSLQLGHADVAVTARHNAKWIGGSTYREPVKIREGEVPADFLSRLEHDGTPVSLPSVTDLPAQ